ncbi:hypothetical protein CAOG_009532 [Capsaspora owczarzaki ATCC 30864]|uniref:Uncharacterized protein n=1 Tax=Capsaspora owczarzaki (strain ATCC 30864) TaxID=595528 RepID=A0A0D2VM22_CAPO3|nr:hypothetical protein CAOG_009532 [Capsaspora owczarzaki ATCC 30864]
MQTRSQHSAHFTQCLQLKAKHLLEANDLIPTKQKVTTKNNNNKKKIPHRLSAPHSKHHSPLANGTHTSLKRKLGATANSTTEVLGYQLWLVLEVGVNQLVGISPRKHAVPVSWRIDDNDARILVAAEMRAAAHSDRVVANGSLGHQLGQLVHHLGTRASASCVARAVCANQHEIALVHGFVGNVLRNHTANHLVLDKFGNLLNRDSKVPYPFRIDNDIRAKVALCELAARSDERHALAALRRCIGSDVRGGACCRR